MNKLARAVNREKPNKKIFDSIKFRFLPNIKILNDHTEYKYKASINKEGWRIPCFDIDKRPDLFVVGG